MLYQHSQNIHKEVEVYILGGPASDARWWGRLKYYLWREVMGPFTNLKRGVLDLGLINSYMKFTLLLFVLFTPLAMPA